MGEKDRLEIENFRHSIEGKSLSDCNNTPQHIDTDKIIAKVQAEAKDRVDIFLKKHKEMRDEISELKHKNKVLNQNNDYLVDIITAIGIPLEAVPAIIPNTISIRHNDILGTLGRTQRISVTFDMDINKLRNEL